MYVGTMPWVRRVDKTLEILESVKPKLEKRDEECIRLLGKAVSLRVKSLMSEILRMRSEEHRKRWDY